MTNHQNEDDPSERHLEPAPVAQAGEIDGGVTPQPGAGDHPADGVEHHHDLDGDVLPADAPAETSEDARASPETGTSSSGLGATD
jgi:hypothetical protein